jgi:hypothetical protein
MEEIQQFLGEPPYKAGLCTKGEYKLFEHTANTAEVAGLDARHALGKFTPPPDPMPLAVAEALVGTVLQRAFYRAISDAA